MREVFQQELEQVRERLIELTGEVTTAIESATLAFRDSDVQLAESVISNDEHIDELAAALDEMSITILARQQPVARDLRTVVSALRISASIERMGDLASHIAQLARYRFPDKVVPKALRETFTRLGELDVELAHDLHDLLVTEDLSIAEKIKAQDDEVDALHQKVFHTVLDASWEGSPVDTVDVTLASRYHERFADHVVAIAQKVSYLATGDWVEQPQ